MKKLLAAAIALGLGGGVAQAADMPMGPPMQMVAWSWTGLYIGGQFGAFFGNSQITDPAGPAIYGNNVRTTGVLGGVQVGYNWQIPNTAFVVGAEADASAIGSAGSATCLGSSPYLIAANCRVLPDAMGSMTARLGYAFGPHGRNVVYVKGGLAWLDDRVDVTTNGLLSPVTTAFDGMRWGWTVGAGIDRALTPAWSLRLEYDYAKFGDLGVTTPASYVQTFPPFTGSYAQTPGGIASMSQNVQTVKVGLNYKVGEDMFARWEPSTSLRGAYIPDAEIEVGGRVWYSSGSFQKDLGVGAAPSPSNLLVSRLTYGSTAATGEVFGRIDTASNIFVKGLGGGGAILSGNQHDEDFNIGDSFYSIPYSNTQATTKGDLAYGTFDIGYSMFRGPSANVGAFVGFNYYRENKQAYGCAQIANSYSDCVPAFANSVLGITEDDNWYSMRVGVNGVVSIWNDLKLTADAAWLPFVAFRGTDIHWQRFDVANQTSPETGNGQGMQLEAILSYAFASGFNIGAGGRYWAMWANAQSNSFSLGCPCQTLPVRAERYGAFVQAAYKFDSLKF
ncbi:MAG: outer membrane beta-barrel protein [Bradyrhizobium sp.]|nr:outer membrane beta-barrel protein [Bradyrhizobium sp.]